MKKNLLIITLHADPSMPPGVGEWGGTHTYMRELLTELSNTDYNIVLITRKVFKEDSDLERITKNEVIVRLTLGNFGDFDKRQLFDLHKESVSQIKSKLKQLTFIPDIIHSVYWNSGHAAMKLAEHWKIPYVHSVISNGIGRNIHGASGTAEKRIDIEKLVFLHASYIICVSQSEKEEISNYYKISSNKIIVAGQYVHPAFIYASHNEYGAPRISGINYKIEEKYHPSLKETKNIEAPWWGQKVFTYTGRLSLDKGLHYIAQAWYSLVKKYSEICPPLWIIGGNTVDIQDIRTKLGIPLQELEKQEKNHRLIWWGYLDENGISALYTRTLVLLTHSLYEPGGRVAVEAMCEGIPVIATPNGFALDSIRDWKNGFLVPFGNVDELICRMEYFIKQPYLANVLGRCAKDIGNNILYMWSFKKNHLQAYSSALSLTSIQNIDNRYDLFNEFDCSRELSIYPYNTMTIDEIDIKEIMENNNLNGIISIKKIKLENSSSLIWECISDKNIYIVKISYDRINYSPLWSAAKTEPLVISGLNRYLAEVNASTYKGIAGISGKDNSRHAIVREKYVSVPICHIDKAKNTVRQLNILYQNDISPYKKLFIKMDDLLNKNKGYQEIDALYKSFCHSLSIFQNYFKDYSLRVELKRWKDNYLELPNFKRYELKGVMDSYEWILETAKKESEYSPVLVQGGCDIKNLIFTPETKFVDNEKLHVGWPGMDYADLFITIIRHRKEPESIYEWNYLLNLVPSNIISKKLIAGWIILGAYKEAISDAYMFLPYNNQLKKRIELIIKTL